MTESGVLITQRANTISRLICSAMGSIGSPDGNFTADEYRLNRPVGAM
ncbi:hypothetical protein [Saccharothrix sp. NRRL B-16314]|nr:hypothetical protein [Saccharothrix sp. NRRL B-16314]